MILWQTGNWNFTLHENPRFAGEAGETPKDGSRFETPKSIHPCGESLDEKVCFEASKP